MIYEHKITEFLANKELSSYLGIAKDIGNQEFILKYKPKLGDLALFIAEQNGLNARAKKKLPSFHLAGCIYTARSFEQSTHEEVATYRASKIKGEHILTLASGLGVDDFALSKNCQKIISIDNDSSLNLIANHNFKLLPVENIERISISAETFLQENNLKFDSIYIDPDRRDEKDRQILLSQHQPDVIALLPRLLEISENVWIKCSPLYDIEMALREIETISEIYCISFKGEVKEMLLKVGRVKPENIKTICTDIGTSKIIEAEFTAQDSLPKQADVISGFFYEAGSALVKARKNHTYAFDQGLQLIDKQVPFYIGKKENNHFMGKCLPIVGSFPFNAKQIKIYLKTNNIRQINIKIRGINIDANALFKKLEVKEGGDDFLFICPYMDKNIFIHCSPLKDLGPVINNEI